MTLDSPHLILTMSKLARPSVTTLSGLVPVAANLRLVKDVGLLVGVAGSRWVVGAGRQVTEGSSGSNVVLENTVGFDA
jgi:hypothetical protein